MILKDPSVCESESQSTGKDQDFAGGTGALHSDRHGLDLLVASRCAAMSETLASTQRAFCLHVSGVSKVSAATGLLQAFLKSCRRMCMGSVVEVQHRRNFRTWCSTGKKERGRC